MKKIVTMVLAGWLAHGATAAVINFTAAEGYVAGELGSHADWTGGGTDFMVDPSGSGAITNVGAAGGKVLPALVPEQLGQLLKVHTQYQPSFSLTEQLPQRREPQTKISFPSSLSTPTQHGIFPCVSCGEARRSRAILVSFSLNLRLAIPPRLFTTVLQFPEHGLV